GKFTNLNIVQIGPLGGFQISNTVGNPTMTPERQRELEAGFDATLLNNRANVEFSLYEKHISDLLVNQQTAPSLGYTTIQLNGGTMRTRGVEAALNLVGIQTPTVQWSTRFSFAAARSKVLSIGV